MSKNDPQHSRNALMFDEWWHGTSIAALQREFGIGYNAIRAILNRESNKRGLPHFGIVTKLRNEFGSFNLAPQNRAELRAYVIQWYDLGEKEE